MKIHWDGFTRLIKDFQRNNEETASKTGERGGEPLKFAQVKETQGKYLVVLRWGDNEQTCRVDTPVQKGEYLSLEFKGWRGNRQFYKVLAHSFEPVPEEDRFMHKAHLLINGLKEAPLPLLFRFINGEKEKKERDKHAPWQGEGNDGEHTLQFIIETDELGIILISVEKRDGAYSGRLCVETAETGRILEKGLGDLQEAITMILEEKKVKLKLCRWEIIPALVLMEIRGDLHHFSYIVDQKV